jgi:hypothetical protein
MNFISWDTVGYAVHDGWTFVAFALLFLRLRFSPLCVDPFF